MFSFGFVNKQNVQIWSDTNWKDILRIWNLFPSKNEANANVTVNGERFRDIMNKYFFQNMEWYPYFGQDVFATGWRHV